jgi:hypothetical protein
LRSLEGIVQKIREFAPPSETQRFVQASALKIAGELTGTRWTLAVQEGSEPPSAFIYVLLFWLTLLFINFGLFAQRNALAIVAVFVCALTFSYFPRFCGQATIFCSPIALFLLRLVSGFIGNSRTIVRLSFCSGDALEIRRPP